MKARTIIIALMSVFASACTIKEDRTACPCWLEVDVTLCRRYSDEVSLKGWNSKGPLFGEYLTIDDWPEGWETSVPKGLVEYTAYSCIEDCVLAGNALIAKDGGEFDPMWAYHASLHAEGETAHDKVTLHKQYTKVTVKMKEEPVGNVTARVKAGSIGFSLADLSPVAGDLDFITGKADEGGFVFNLPRQGDGTAMMEVLCNGAVYRTLELGRLIAETGFDWSAEDLDDLYILIDLTTTEVDIRIEDWQTGAVYEMASVAIDLAQEAPTKSSFSWGEAEIKDVQAVILEEDGSVWESVYAHAGTSLSFNGQVGRRYTILVAANLGQEVPVSRLEDFTAQRSVSRSGIAANGIPMFSSGRDAVTVASGGGPVTVVVTRMLARVDFNIDRRSLGTPDGLIVKSLGICNGTSSYTPFADRATADGSAVESFDTATAADITSLNSGGTVSLYAFENMQGTLLPGNTNPWAKVPSSISTPGRCSYLEMTCSYSSGGRSSDDITYRMYLGSDATTNFDVRRNRVYTLTLRPSEEEIYGLRGSWKIESSSWVDKRPASLSFNILEKAMWADGPNAGTLGTWTPVLTVTYMDGTSRQVIGSITSSNSSVASVSGMTVTGRSAGTATLHATYTEYGVTIATAQDAVVTVTDPLLDFRLDPSELVMAVGSTESSWKATAVYPSGDVILPWNATTYNAGNLTWEITSTTQNQPWGQAGGGGGGGGGGGNSRPRYDDFTLTTRTSSGYFGYTYAVVVSCDSNAGKEYMAPNYYDTYEPTGVLTATYTEGGVTMSASCAISATEAAATGYDFYLSDSSLSLNVGEDGVLNCYVTTTYSNGTSTTTNASAVWTTTGGSSSIVGPHYSDCKLNTGSPAHSILFIANGTGSTVITAVYTDPDGGRWTRTCNVYVGQAAPTVSYEIEVSPLSVTLSQGGRLQFKAMLYTLENGIRDSGTNITEQCSWSSTNTSVASVSQAGLVTASSSGSGTATITASCTAPDGTALQSSSSVVVTAASVEYIAFSMSPSDIIRGGTSTGTVIAHLDNSQYIDVTSSSTFSIISGGGSMNDNVLTGTAVGDVVIMASYGGAYDNATVTVREPRAVGLGLTMSPSTAVVGGTSTANVVATYENGEIADVTSRCSLSVLSGPGRLDGNVLTGTAAGTVVVQASYGGLVTTTEVVFTTSITYYTLTLVASPSAGGTVSGAGTYPAGTTVTVSAEAADGYAFSSWSDGGAQTHSFVISRSTTLTAIFEEESYDIHID